MNEEGVLEFLKEFRRAMAQFRLLVVDRGKNNATLDQLELTKKNQEDIIFGLTVADYVKGPEPDRDQPGDIWVFGKTVAGNRLYIKIRLTDSGPISRAKCISFHPAEEPLTFPYGE